MRTPYKGIECEPCTYLQESGEDFSQTESLDIPHWLQSNGNPTLVKSCENEQQTDGSPACKCGKGMFDCSIHPSTPEAWTAFMQDSLAKTLVSLANKQESLKELDQVFTEKYCVLLASLDRDSCSWKMSPQLRATDLTRYSKTWPSWGMTQDGSAYAHRMSGRITTGTDGSYLPTPTRHNGQEGGYPGEGRRRSPPLGWVLGGKINPQFTEWMMGWPIGYTALEQSETVKSLSKQQPRLPSWLRG